MLQIKSKFKIGKRLGAGVFEQCQTQRFALSEMRSQQKRRTGRRRNVSDYGKQLIEKQKVRYTYGLHEAQFARYVKIAMESENPINALHAILESRLDNTVYRLGLAPTRRAARQMVSHGHIKVGSKRMTIPSHQVRVGDVITVRDGSRTSPLFTSLATEEGKSGSGVPAWLSLNEKTLEAKVVAVPTHTTDILLDYPAVFEYYSR
jgi:small subunit ribosomal protein S4